MKKMKTAAILALSCLFLFSAVSCGDNRKDSGDSASSSSSSSSGAEGPAGNTAEQQQKIDEALSALGDQDFTYAQLTGTDSLGRKTLPTIGNEKKYVGLFYFVATGYVNTDPWNYSMHNKVYDISKLLEKYGDDKLTNPVMALPSGITAPYYDPSISPEGLAHFWGEPLYGYYRSDDPWVVRKHLELFMNAGIDFLYLDYTNNIIYEGATKVLLDAVSEMVEAGYENVPKVVPMLSYNPSWASWTFPNVYSAYFANEKYDKCWFRADEALNPSGKPLIIGNIAADSANADKFWIKNIQWPGQAFDEDAVPWMDWDLVQKNHNGVMTVTVAQGGSSSSEAYFDPDVHYQARGYTPFNPGAQGTDEKGVLEGSNFEFKWENAIKARDELDIVTVTGWNEWIVRKLATDDPAAHHWDWGEYVDSFTMALSRDAEMMKGGYGDNYYMQIARNIRRFRGRTVENSDNVASNEKATVVIDNLSEWEKISRRYLDLGTSTVERNHTSVDRDVPYKDDSARNDIDYLKICNDGQNLYVAVTAKEDIEPYKNGDTGWMNLYLSAGEDSGWENYNFVVNRNPDTSAGCTSIERFTGTGSEVKAAGSAKYFLSGKTIVYSFPLSALGVTEGSVIEIKATDNLQRFGEADDFYISGDSAPMGRLNYAYRIA